MLKQVPQPLSETLSDILQSEVRIHARYHVWNTSNRCQNTFQIHTMTPQDICWIKYDNTCQILCQTHCYIEMLEQVSDYMWTIKSYNTGVFSLHPSLQDLQGKPGHQINIFKAVPSHSYHFRAPGFRQLPYDYHDWSKDSFLEVSKKCEETHEYGTTGMNSLQTFKEHLWTAICRQANISKWQSMKSPRDSSPGAAATPERWAQQADLHGRSSCSIGHRHSLPSRTPPQSTHPSMLALFLQICCIPHAWQLVLAMQIW